MLKDKQPVWASWSANAVLIYRQGQEKAEQVLDHSTHPDWRYFLKLYKRNDGTLLLRTGDSSGTLLYEAIRAGPFRPVKDWPDSLGSLPPSQVMPGKNGCVAGISRDKSQLILWKSENPLLKCDLPNGFIAADVDWDCNQLVWICGASPTKKLKSLEHRRSFAVSHNAGNSWRFEPVPHRGFKVSWLSVLSGAEEMYRKVNSENGYLVLSAETDDLDNTSTFLFVRDSHVKWTSGILKGDVLRAVLPVLSQGIEIVSHRCQSISITSGQKWRYRNLVPRIHNVVQSLGRQLPKDMRYEILDARATSEGGRLIVVSVRLPQRDQLSRFGEAVLMLNEDGDRLVAFHGEEDAEIVTACC